MQLKNINKKALWLWYFYAVIELALISGAYTLALVFGGQARIVLAISLGTVYLLLLAVAFILPKLKYDRYKYGFDERRIVVERGVIFRHRVVIPICQIQDLHRVEGPFMLILGLSGVEISTAGSNFTLCFLAKEDADAMIDALLENLERITEEKADEEIL